MSAESISRAADAYDHAARVARNRASISPMVDGDASGAVAHALEAVAVQLNDCASGLRRSVSTAEREHSAFMGAFRE